MSGDILPQASDISGLSARIAAAASTDELVALALEAPPLVALLHADGAGPAWVTRVRSCLSDVVTRRALELLGNRFRLPPTPWCWLGFGSEGRLEQTLVTDQDNGLIFSASDDGEARHLRERFLPFAQEVNRILDECGIALCDGDVMAGNPKWCLSQSEWMECFSSWVRTPEPDALLNAAIFFDFRPLAGNASLATDLRRLLSDLTRGNEIFLRMMTTNAIAASPPLGRLRDFAVEADLGGKIDLKKYGTRIFVDAARILALGTGIDETGTASRLRRIAVDAVISPADAEAAVYAFHSLQGIRLSVQAGSSPEGVPDNQVHPDRLNEFDRRVLLAALRQARTLQQQLKVRFHIDT